MPPGIGTLARTRLNRVPEGLNPLGRIAQAVPVRSGNAACALDLQAAFPLPTGLRGVGFKVDFQRLRAFRTAQGEDVIELAPIGRPPH